MANCEYRKLNRLVLACRHVPRSFQTVGAASEEALRHFESGEKAPTCFRIDISVRRPPSAHRCSYLRSPVTVTKPLVPSR